MLTCFLTNEQHWNETQRAIVSVNIAKKASVAFRPISTINC